jgi:hypothetical protein
MEAAHLRLFALNSGVRVVPEAIAEQNAQAFSLTAEGDAERVSDDVATILGRWARSYEQFATDYAPAFS